MISESFKVVIRITNKFILMGQKKTQRLVVLLYQTNIVKCNVYLTIHQFSLLKPKQSIQKLLEKRHEMVNQQAKSSLSLEPTSFKIPFSNFKPSINKYILEELQTSWNNSIGNKLFDTKPTIGEYQSVVRNIRKDEVVLARLRLGHTRVTHSYLLQGEEQPQYVGCDAPFTERHFLLECGDFAQVRNNCFHVDNMKELFQDIHIDSIMTFLRQINLFNKI